MNCITKLHMSYSNGKLPEDTISHGKIIEIVKGLPGVVLNLLMPVIMICRIKN